VICPTKSLGELCELQIGRTPPREIASYWGCGAPWLSISDMGDGDDIYETKEEITGDAIEDCHMKIVPEGNVVLSFKLSLGKYRLDVTRPNC